MRRLIGFVFFFTLLPLEGKESFPYMAEVEESVRLPGLFLPKGKKVAVLSHVEDLAWVVFPSSRVFLVPKEAVLAFQNQGYLRKNHVRVFGENRKKIGELQKGDRIEILGEKGAFYVAKSKDLLQLGKVPQVFLRPLSQPIPKRWHWLVISFQKEREKPPCWDEVMALRKRLERELKKDLEKMDLKPVVLECMLLKKKVKERFCLRVIEEIQSRALEAERVRREYLEMTAELRRKIQSVR